MEGAWGWRLPREAVQIVVVSAVATVGLFLAAPSADAEQLSTTVSAYGIRVRVYSQMCDNGFQHTRLNVKNLSGQPVYIDVSDPRARSINFGSSGFVPAGTGKPVHIVASSNAPARTATVTVDPGGPIAVPIPYKQCAEVVPTTVVTLPLPPVPLPATPVAEVIPKVATEVKSGTLPFTGSDVRFISAVAAVLVLLGGAFMLIQYRIDSQKTLIVGEELTRRGIFGPY
jgi:hypothetical protein